MLRFSGDKPYDPAAVLLAGERESQHSKLNFY